MKRTACLTVLGSLGISSLLGAAEWPSQVTWKPDERAVKSGLYIKPHEAAKSEKVAFSVTEPSGVERKNWPVRGGLPLSRGELTDPTKIRLLDASGKEIPVQGMASAFWPEGSAKFLCIDFLTDLKVGEEKTFTLEYGSSVANKSPAASVSESAGTVTVKTGAATFSFKTGTAFLEVKTVKPANSFGPFVGKAMVAKNNQGSDPVAHNLTIDEISVAERGPVQTTVHLVGHYGTQRSACEKLYNNSPSPTKDAWRYPVSMWYRIDNGAAQAELEFCFGYNGDEYSDFVASYGFTIPTGQKKGVFKFGADDQAEQQAPLGSRLNQWSNNEWSLSGKEAKSGKRIAGWAAIEGGGSRAAIVMREAFQNWPMAFRADDNGDLSCEVMGEKSDRALDLVYMETFTEDVGAQKLHKSHNMECGPALSSEYCNSVSWGRAAAMRKIHELFLDFAAPESRSGADIGKAFQKPLVPWPGQQRFKDTKALGHIGVWGEERWKIYQTFYSAMFDCMPLLHELNGLYGWVDWGDFPVINESTGQQFQIALVGAEGWSNGERAVASYFWHYAAGGGRRFLDYGRAFVFHTIGIDTEHEGGDHYNGTYHRHDQVHWREDNPNNSRQGGYRGWHAYHWLTGDQEVKRLALAAGIDSDAYRNVIDVRPTTDLAIVSIGGAFSSDNYLAFCCWVTTGDWRYARTNHAFSQLIMDCGKAGKDFTMTTTFAVGKNGEPINPDFSPRKPDNSGGYWYTYGGDDLLLEWASLTGDPVTVDLILAFGKGHEDPKARESHAIYHSPEALYLAMAFLDPKNPQVLAMNQSRDMPAAAYVGHRKLTGLDGTYTSAGQWTNFNVWLFGKNALSTQGGTGVEFLYRMRGLEICEQAAAGATSFSR